MDKQKASFPDAQDDHWLQYLRDNKAKEGERLEDAAKFLSGMISISLAIFLKVDEEAFSALSLMGFTVAVVGLWLVSLALAFFVFFPFPYRYNEQSPGSVKAFHQKMVRRKRRLLLWSTVCFFGALLLLGIAFVFRAG